MRKTLNVDTKISLIEFCERFVKHNTIVYLYSERLCKDENGVMRRELTHLETVMDWQITSNEEDDAYFEAHPDVKKSKYVFNNVVAVINAFEENFEDVTDSIAIVVDLDNVLCKVHGDTCEGKSFDGEIWVEGLS